MNKSKLDVCTAKRLCNLAQGCRVARLPWDRIGEATPTPKPVTQGSRAARQPWAKVLNRFAVEITFRLAQSFLVLSDKPAKLSSNGLNSFRLSLFQNAVLFLTFAY